MMKPQESSSAQLSKLKCDSPDLQPVDIDSENRKAHAAANRGGLCMGQKTLTRMDLSEAVFREVGLSRNESADLVETVLNHMSDALVEGEQVKISSFGTFSIRDKAARVGRNPKTGEEVPINPRRVLTFRPSHLMKDRVAAGNKG
jgi:integration host factor subunit alpha